MRKNHEIEIEIGTFIKSLRLNPLSPSPGGLNTLMQRLLVRRLW
jgi:hypothetical protein